MYVSNFLITTQLGIVSSSNYKAQSTIQNLGPARRPDASSKMKLSKRRRVLLRDAMCLDTHTVPACIVGQGSSGQTSV